MITSHDNPKVKWMRSLLDGKGRRQEGCFLLEGVILVEEAINAGLAPRLVLFDPAALGAGWRGRQLLDRLAAPWTAQPALGTTRGPALGTTRGPALGSPGGRLPAEEVSAPVLQSVCDTVSPQGVVAACVIPAPPDALPDAGLVVVLDGLRDPGNVGAILRSAGAAGCAAVVTTSGTTDVYAPKVVRAAMGAHLRLALLADTPWPRLSQLLTLRPVYVAEATGGVPYYEVDWRKPAALVIGNETEGPRPDAHHSATGRVSIPMPGRAESLNASIAASIIIFESVRQQLSAKQGA